MTTILESTYLTALITISSVSNGSGLPTFGPGWNQTEAPSLGQELPSIPTGIVLEGCYPDLT